MRATLELDDDVAARLEEISRERNVTVSELVNHLLGDVLGCDSTAAPKRERFKVAPLDLGEPLLADVDDISAVLEYAERLDADRR